MTACFIVSFVPISTTSNWRPPPITLQKVLQQNASAGALLACQKSLSQQVFDQNIRITDQRVVWRCDQDVGVITQHGAQHGDVWRRASP